MVTVGERTGPSTRLAALRRPAHRLRRPPSAPVSEVQAIGSDLLGQVPATAAPGRAARGDRMERLVAQILRGTENDPRARPVRMSAVGAAGVTYGLAAAFDQKLRDRGLRLETDLPAALPPCTRTRCWCRDPVRADGQLRDLHPPRRRSRSRARRCPAAASSNRW